MNVALRRYDFVVNVIKNGRRKVKYSLVRKYRISHVPVKRIPDFTCPRETY